MKRTVTVAASIAALLISGTVWTPAHAASCSIWFLCPPPPPANSPFMPAGPWPGGTAPWFMDNGDLNGDGRPDVVMTNWLGGGTPDDRGLMYYLNTSEPGGPLSFDGPRNLDIGTWGQDVQLVDLTGTGRLDIVASNAVGSGTQFSGEVWVFHNITPWGAFLPEFAPRLAFNAGRVPETIAVDDINLDGRPDLATANWLGLPGIDGASVLLSTSGGPGDVSFAAPQHFNAISFNAQGVALGDLDGDSRPDMVVADSTFFFDTTVNQLRNTTPPGSMTASFAPAQRLSAGIGPGYVSIADLNNDGRDDLTVANLYDPVDYGVSVFMNATPAGALGPTFSSQYRFRADLAQAAVHSHHDFNGDGRNDIVTANWGNHGGFGLNLDGRGYGVSVLLNATPEGSMAPNFEAPIQLETPTGTWDVSHADFDGDGLEDIATPITNTSPRFDLGSPPLWCDQPCGFMVFVNHLEQG